MGKPELIAPKRISLKKHPELNERWVQACLAKDPKLMGLGDLILKDKERAQPRAGRLDLLLQDPETARRYEVEVQLGKTDEPHIIRTIEYWDIERRRYPQYDHCAVLIAEDITSRFLNVIGLFNGFIPLIAIQMSAFDIEGKVALIFTRVLDELPLGLVDEDEEEAEVVDRGYWEAQGSKATLQLADRLLEMIHEWDDSLNFKYNRFYIGLARDGQPNNFVVFRPKKQWVTVEPRLDRDEELAGRMEDEGLDLMDYDTRWGRYRIRLKKEDLQSHRAFIEELLKSAFERANA